MIRFALAVALATLAAGLAAGVGLRRLPTLRLQLAALALMSALLPLAAVVLSGLVMFDSGHDLTILIVAAGSACAPPGGSGTTPSTIPNRQMSSAVIFIDAAACGARAAFFHRIDAHPSGVTTE